MLTAEIHLMPSFKFTLPDNATWDDFFMGMFRYLEADLKRIKEAHGEDRWPAYTKGAGGSFIVKQFTLLAENTDKQNEHNRRNSS